MLFTATVYTAPLMPVQALLRKFWHYGAVHLPYKFHAGLCRMVGIRIHIRGTPVRKRACLIAANHSSWLDIPVLSGCAPVSFISKSEVNSWPVFGSLARLQRTMFVERERRSGTATFKNEMQRRLAEGDRLVLFPEGTSGTGNYVLPFKSALLGAAECEVTDFLGQTSKVLVQPVSVSYTRLHGVPMGRQFRPHYAWFGDMELPPHLWGVLQRGPIDVVVEFHDPVTIDNFANRKELTRYCEDKVSEGVARALAGRELDP